MVSASQRWAPLSTSFFRDPKIRRAGRDAALLYLAGLAYASEELTDGEIPTEVVPILAAEAWAPSEAAQRLEAEGLWLLEPGAYRIASWAEWNRPAEVVRSAIEAKAEGGRRGNHLRHHVARGIVAPGCRYCSEKRSDPDRSSDRSSDRIGVGTEAGSETGFDVVPNLSSGTDRISDRISDRITDQRRSSDRSSDRSSGRFDVASTSIPVPVPAQEQQQQQLVGDPIGEASRLIAERRGLEAISKAKRSPARWLAGAIAGIAAELREHPGLGRAVHDGAGPEELADLLEPRPLRAVPAEPFEPDPSRPLPALTEAQEASEA